MAYMLLILYAWGILWVIVLGVCFAAYIRAIITQYIHALKPT